MPNDIQDISSVDDSTYPYVFEQNVSIRPKGVALPVRVNVYRPKEHSRVPVLVTFGPYGKDVPYAVSVYAIFSVRLSRHNTDADPDSTQSLSLTSARSINANTLHGKLLIRHTGPRMVMRLFVAMKQELDNRPGTSRHSHLGRLKHFMRLSNGLQTNRGRQARLAYLVSATTGPLSGELQHSTQGVSLLSVRGKG